jgi:hypothetical protein
MEPVTFLYVLKACFAIFWVTTTLLLSFVDTSLCSDYAIEAMNNWIVWSSPCDCGGCHRRGDDRPRNCVKPYDEDNISWWVGWGPTAISLLLIAASHWTKMSLWLCIVSSLFGIAALHLAPVVACILLALLVREETDSVGLRQDPPPSYQAITQ